MNFLNYAGNNTEVVLLRFSYTEKTYALKLNLIVHIFAYVIDFSCSCSCLSVDACACQLREDTMTIFVQLIKIIQSQFL